jgi:hypothetical protein
VVDKGEVGSIAAVLASAVGAAWSWAAGLGVGAVLFSVAIGSLLTYIVQTRTQKSAWKREAALRKVDEIYGPLYDEMNRISETLSEASPLTPHPTFTLYPPEVGWRAIKAGYRYYLIEGDLRNQLGEFHDLLEKLEANQRRIYGIVDAKLLPRLREAFGDDVQAVQYQVTAKQPNGMPISIAGEAIYEPILEGKNPLELTRARYPGYTDYELELSLQRAGQMLKFFGQGLPNQGARERFDRLLADCMKEVASDSTITLIQDQASKLKKSADALKARLREAIEKPWNV